MSMETLMIVLATWTISGLAVAILFGHMVPREERDQQESPATASVDNLKYFRRKKRVATARKAWRGIMKRNLKQRSASANDMR